MERLKSMKDTLITCAQGQMANLERVNAQELGEVVDMIKDIDEAMYYCSIVKSMEENEKEKEYAERYAMMQPRQETTHHYYTVPPYYGGMGMNMMMPSYYEDPYREMGYQTGRMYYSGGGGRSGYSSGSSGGSSGGNSGGSSGGNSSGGNNARGGGTRGYDSYEYPRELRDFREGKSPMSRRGYMESKEQHQGKEVQIKELEKYLNELAEDITEMVEEASPEEKQMLQQKLNTLATKMK